MKMEGFFNNVVIQFFEQLENSLFRIHYYKDFLKILSGGNLITSSFNF